MHPADPRNSHSLFEFPRNCHSIQRLLRRQTATATKRHKISWTLIKQRLASDSETPDSLQDPLPKDPAVLKIPRDSELLCRSVFTTRPPFLYYAANPPPLREEMPAKTRKICVSAGVVAIVNHCAIVNLLRIVKLLRRSIFSTAGSFGLGVRTPKMKVFFNILGSGKFQGIPGA